MRRTLVSIAVTSAMAAACRAPASPIVETGGTGDSSGNSLNTTDTPPDTGTTEIPGETGTPEVPEDSGTAESPPDDSGDPIPDDTGITPPIESGDDESGNSPSESGYFFDTFETFLEETEPPTDTWHTDTWCCETWNG